MRQHCKCAYTTAVTFNNTLKIMALFNKMVKITTIRETVYVYNNSALNLRKIYIYFIGTTCNSMLR